MADHLRPGLLRDVHQVVERDHLPGVGTHIELAQIARGHARGLPGLHINPIRAIVVIEIVDISGAHVDAQRGTDLAERDTQRLCLDPIDGDQQLRIARRVAGVQADQLIAPGGWRR